MFATMAVVLVCWCLLIIAFAGFGYALFSIFRFEEVEDRFFYAFWTGFCLVLFFLQLWHFALPINGKALILFLVLGACGFVLTIREIAGDLRKFANIYQLLLICGLALFLANRALAPMKLFDAGLYHLATIQWDSSYPIVPGLGNLMDRYGMNNAYFLYHAFLDPFPFVRSFHLANGLLLFVLVLQMSASFFRVAIRKAGTVDWFLLILLPAAFGQMLDHAEDTSTDFAIFIMGCLIGIRLCFSLLSTQSTRQKAFDVFYISLLAVTAISIKISANVFGVLAVLIVLMRHRSKASWLLPAFCIFVVWVAGNIVLTGHPMFPSRLFAVHADWTMPERTVLNFERGVRFMARDRHGDFMTVLNTWSWLGEWSKTLFARQKFFEIVLPFCLFIGGIILLRKKERASLWLIVPALMSTIYWFRAPDPRFAGASFWWLVAGIWAPALGKVRVDFKYLFAFLITACLVVSRIYYAPIIVRYGPIQHYETALTHFVTDTGVLLFVPIEVNSCWESPLPCTGTPDRKLRLRKNDDLGGGFALDR